MRFFSYLIIATISLIIGLSSVNSFDLIKQKKVAVFQPSFPNLEERYLLEPIVNIIIANAKS